MTTMVTLPVMTGSNKVLLHVYSIIVGWSVVLISDLFLITHLSLWFTVGLKIEEWRLAPSWEVLCFILLNSMLPDRGKKLILRNMGFKLTQLDVSSKIRNGFGVLTLLFIFHSFSPRAFFFYDMCHLNNLRFLIQRRERNIISKHFISV